MLLNINISSSDFFVNALITSDKKKNSFVVSIFESLKKLVSFLLPWKKKQSWLFKIFINDVGIHHAKHISKEEDGIVKKA